MQSPAFTIKAFGLYAAGTGMMLVLAPNVLLGLFGVPAAADVWIRVLGSVAVVLGYYYWACGAANAKPFFHATLRGRALYFVLCLVLVFVYEAPPALVLFGVVDLAGAAWTALALRHEAQSGA